jgi:hypothetical protein
MSTYSQAITRQYMLASGAVQIENPDKAADAKATALAAVGSLLKTYQAILQQKPDDSTISARVLVHSISPCLLLQRPDRFLWVLLSRWWPGWRRSLHIVRPDTVIAWHRRAFAWYWTRKSRRRPGRPNLAAEIRILIRNMSQANPLWGAPRIHGELLKLGIEVAQSTVAKYLRRPRKPPSQSWRTFLTNHMDQMASSLCFSFVRDWVEKKVRRHLMRARERTGFGWKRWSTKWLYQQLGLYHDYRLLRPWSLPKAQPAVPVS